MSLLIVGSIALDSVETPAGETTDALGGSAVFAGVAASFQHPPQVVGVMGSDFPADALAWMRERGLDLAGVDQVPGETFRWKGKYSDDFSSRETLDTRLGVFADFAPRIPSAFADATYVFLGNIDPELQLNVLDQVTDARLTACDTMNYWIESKRGALLELMQRIDILMINDDEARQLSGEWNIHRAAEWILHHGPSMTVIKKGEHGAVLVAAEQSFFVPGFPLLDVLDPTGAGDAFAGGFMAHIASLDDTTPESIRRAMVYGAAMGSFAVEEFSVRRFEALEASEVHSRVHSFRELVHFDVAEVGR